MKLPVHLERLARDYGAAARQRGATSLGVGWSTPKAQTARLKALARLLDGAGAQPVTIADLGCGWGALWDILGSSRSPRISRYDGYDITPELLTLARGRFAGDVRVRLAHSHRADRDADFGFISGVFNYSAGVPDQPWRRHARREILDFAARCRRGVGFNFLRSGGKSSYGMFYSTPKDWRALADGIAAARGGRVEFIDDYLPEDFAFLIRFPPS